MKNLFFKIAAIAFILLSVFLLSGSLNSEAQVPRDQTGAPCNVWNATYVSGHDACRCGGTDCQDCDCFVDSQPGNPTM